MRAEMHFTLPLSLKQRVVAEWESIVDREIVPSITRKNREKTISAIINKEFLKDKSLDISQSDELVMEALLLYFDEAVGSILLYDVERAQFEEVSEKKPESKRFCDLCGIEYLLRLFVRLPTLVAHTRLSLESAVLWRAAMDKLTAWLSSRPEEWWTK